MPIVRAFVWHDSAGKILAVGHPVAGSQRTILPVAGGNGGVLAADIDEEDLPLLIESHAVDIEGGYVVERADPSAPA